MTETDTRLKKLSQDVGEVCDLLLPQMLLASYSWWRSRVRKNNWRKCQAKMYKPFWLTVWRRRITTIPNCFEHLKNTSPYTPSFVSSVALFNSRIASLVSGRRSHAIAPQHMLIFLHLLCSACRQNWMINPMPRDMQANKPVSVNVKDVVIIHYKNIF